MVDFPAGYVRVPIHPPRYGGRFKVTATTGHVYSLDFSQAQGKKDEGNRIWFFTGEEVGSGVF